MLVRFSTRHGQLIMHGEPAIAMLRLGGHTGTVPGAVLAADLPAFLQRLREGIATVGDAPSPAPSAAETTTAAPDDENGPRERPVMLRQRAVPLLEMIETALKRKSDLMWEKT